MRGATMTHDTAFRLEQLERAVRDAEGRARVWRREADAHRRQLAAFDDAAATVAAFCLHDGLALTFALAPIGRAGIAWRIIDQAGAVRHEGADLSALAAALRPVLAARRAARPAGGFIDLRESYR